MTITKPVAGRSYSLSVHGEPPEGVEVLWGPADRVLSFSSIRFDGDTHWMLAPVPAPEPAETDEGGGEPKKGHKGMTAEEFYARRDKPMVDHLKASRDLPDDATVLPWNETAEEPPFPLSREEYKTAWAGCDVQSELKKRGYYATVGWMQDLPQWQWNRIYGNYDATVSAWRAADCPGAEAEAPEGEAEEGPWQRVTSGHIVHEDGSEFYTGNDITSTDCDGYAVQDRIVSDANESPRLRGELEKARAEVKSLLVERQELADLVGAVAGPMPDVLFAAVRSLVDRNRRNERVLRELQQAGTWEMVVELVEKIRSSHAGEGA